MLIKREWFQMGFILNRIDFRNHLQIKRGDLNGVLVGTHRTKWRIFQPAMFDNTPGHTNPL